MLFVFFMFGMSVIVMNMFVGLAVDDIKGVQERAVLQRLAMQVNKIHLLGNIGNIRTM